jgi:hypothetical protein
VKLSKIAKSGLDRDCARNAFQEIPGKNRCAACCQSTDIRESFALGSDAAHSADLHIGALFARFARRLALRVGKDFAHNILRSRWARRRGNLRGMISALVARARQKVQSPPKV